MGSRVTYSVQAKEWGLGSSLGMELRVKPRIGVEGHLLCASQGTVDDGVQDEMRSTGTVSLEEREWQ
eukprot:1145356-Pelagomonas_calceolata.AAC.4